MLVTEISIEQQSIHDESSNKSVAKEIERPSHASFLSCWTVLSKTAIGVGLLGLASATAACGWILGIFLLVLAGSAAMFTLHLINCLIMMLGRRHVSFYTVADRYAPAAKWIVDIAIAIKSLGVGTAYFQVYGTEMARFVARVAPQVKDHMSMFTLRLLMICIGLLVMIPICFRKSIAKTAIINILGILGITYIVAIGVVFTDADYPAEHSLSPTGSFVSIAAKFPIFIFTFTCHQNMFLVGEDMKDRSQKKLDLVALSSHLTGWLLFLPALICPYMTYGAGVGSNFLDSMSANPNIKDSIAVIMAGLALAIAEISAYPLQLFPCRRSTMVLVSAGRELSTLAEKKLRRILTACILLMSTTIAIFVEDLGVTLSVVGIIGSNTICFIMPSFFYCKAFDRKKNMLKWYLSATVCTIATILLPICLTAIIINAVNKTKKTE
jgi:amino acid permease